jgi:ABC-type sulfate transport system permease component
MFSEAQKSALAANIILPILTIGAVSARLAVFNRTNGGFGISEYIILLAVVRYQGYYNRITPMLIY